MKKQKQNKAKKQNSEESRRQSKKNTAKKFNWPFGKVKMTSSALFESGQSLLAQIDLRKIFRANIFCHEFTPEERLNLLALLPQVSTRFA